MSILDRLRDPSADGPLSAFVDLVVDDAMGRPLGDVVDVDRWPRLVSEVAAAWANSDVAEDRMIAAVLEGVDSLGTLDGAVGDRLPESVLDGLRQLAARPYSPSRALVLRLIDQPPVRRLLKEILMDAVVGFAKKARSVGEASPVGGLATGLGRLAKQKAGALGALAGAVGTEVERQIERRADEFTENALGGALGGIADQLSDPARAGDQAELRVALLDGALALTGPELAAELRRSDPPALGKLARASLAGWILGDGFEDQIRGLLTELVRSEGGRTLGETLDELDLRDTLTAPARELLLAHARHLVSTPAFAAWLNALEDS